jgi:hypothetical protein
MFECGCIENRFAEHLARTASDIFRGAQQSRVNRCCNIDFARRQLHSTDVSAVDDAHANLARLTSHGTSGKHRAETHVASFRDAPSETIDIIECASCEAIRNDDGRRASFEALITACQFKRAIWSNARGGRETNVDAGRLRFFDERGVEQLACDCNARRTRDTKLARAARHEHAFERSC